MEEGGKQESVIWRSLEKEQDQGKSTFKRRERHTYGLRTKPMGEGATGDSGEW